MTLHLSDAGLQDGANARDGAVGDQDLPAAGRVDEDAQRAAIQLMVPLPARSLKVACGCSGDICGQLRCGTQDCFGVALAGT